jgi:hypothetical protein
MPGVRDALDRLSADYLELHTRREELFWTTRMGTGGPDAPQQSSEAENAWKGFLQDPDRLAALRRLEAQAATDDERRIANGWIAMLSAHVIESADGRRQSHALVERENDLEQKRGAMTLGYRDPDTDAFVPASSVRLGLMARTAPDARLRRAAFDGLRSIERFVLDNGFLDIVRLRNRLARTLGFPDYYAWRVHAVERMDKRRLFQVLDDLAQRTKASTTAALSAFSDRHGADALEPWNFPYLKSGRLTAAFDPYFPFAAALRRWGRSFAALGVAFRGATLTLDLLDRPGKYENGFMHGPKPAFFDRGRWRPARINFTANAVVGQVGAGHRALETLFHEGGHAAHFANILADAPCFSHEYAPTSVAYAETQSMFMDSLVGDASWMTRYALDGGNQAVPLDLVRESIDEEQPFLGWGMRAMMTVPFAERAIYETPDDDLTADHVLDICRSVERDLQGLTAGVRPVLSVPHLLSAESSAYYHGYVLAEMAVHATRRFFRGRDGFLTDNPRIGPDLARSYWQPGNAQTFDQTLTALIGSPLSADALVDACNRTPAAAFAEALSDVERARDVAPFDAPVALDATVRVVHGTDEVATTEDGGFEGACLAFERWVDERSAAKKPGHAGGPED